jgi:hypothetical protein
MFQAAMMARWLCISVRILATFFLIFLRFSNFVVAENGMLCTFSQWLVSIHKGFDGV